jgi:5'-3' exonuclease
MNLGYDYIDGTVALIDGDILLYRIGFTTQEETEAIALVRLNQYIDDILYKSKASDYKLYLTGSNNFRKTIYPEYKANRKAEKPKHFKALKDYMINFEQAILEEDQEADDAMGINQTDSTIICSIDKDLLMIPGRHYNFVKEQHVTITEDVGRRNFYRQLLMGDSTDNIPGLAKVGKVRAEKLLGSANTEEEYKEIVLGAYTAQFGSDAMDRINMIGKLIWIRRKENEVWSFD